MLTETEIFSLFLNYGIAGLILYVFYKMFSNELLLLRQAINEMNKNISILIKKLDRLDRIGDKS